MARSGERKAAMRGSKKREPSSASEQVGDGRRWRGFGEGALAPSRTRGRARARITGDREEERGRGKGSEATEPRRREDGVLPSAPASAQRASASAGARDRHPKGEDRVSGLRGAGRGEAASGGIEPGDRSEGPGGRPYVPAGRADDNEPSLITERDDPQAEEIEGSSNRAQSDRLLVARDASMAKGKTAELMIAAALKTDEQWRERKNRRASGDGALAPSRTRGRRGGAWQEGGAGSASGGGAKRRAAKRDTGHGVRNGPIPRRSEGPAPMDRGCATLTRRCCRPGCRAGGPCRRGSR